MAQNNQPTHVPPGDGHQARNQGGHFTGRRGRYAANGRGGYYGSNNWRGMCIQWTYPFRVQFPQAVRCTDALGPSRAQESAHNDFAAAQGIRFGGSPVPTPLSDAGVYMGFSALNASINPIRDDGTESEPAAGAISQQITPASTRGATPSSTDEDLKYKRISMTNDSVAQRDADLAANICGQHGAHPLRQFNPRGSPYSPWNSGYQQDYASRSCRFHGPLQARSSCARRSVHLHPTNHNC